MASRDRAGTACASLRQTWRHSTRRQIGRPSEYARAADRAEQRSFIYSSSPQARWLVSLSLGVFLHELATILAGVADGHERNRMRYIVGHDGTMNRLIGALRLQSPMRWPPFGAEVTIESWRSHRRLFGRVLLGGEIAIGPMPLSALIARLRALVPADIVEACNS